MRCKNFNDIDPGKVGYGIFWSSVTRRIIIDIESQKHHVYASNRRNVTGVGPDGGLRALARVLRADEPAG